LNENPIVLDFVTHAKPIWDATYDVVYQIMASFDAPFPGAQSKIFDAEHVHILLRFLKYNWAESGKYLAKPHFDAGSFSLAIAESCPGLRIGTGPDDLELIQHQDNHALFMISSNHKKIIDSDAICAGWHDVIQMDETQIGKPFSRWALVAFIEGQGVEALPRTETHKWYKGEL
jgi:hypothetical protein